MILHSPYGLRVHGPLALAVSRRLRERYDIDEKPTASDDGIVVRLPDTGLSPGEDRPPGAELFVFDADEIDPIVTAEVGGSALFASRFRECAARALLLPHRHPGRRSPLWHQRQRAAQLLEVARKYPDFPIVLETVRECLQDVYDVPTLVELMAGIAQRKVRVLETETRDPPPLRRHCCSATSARSCTRATPRWPSAAPRRSRWTARCWPNCSAESSFASCSIPRSSPRPAGNCSTCRRTEPHAMPKASRICCDCWAR